MKRFFAFFVTFSLIFSVFAAESAEEEESPFQQYQTFSWEAVPKAKRYELIIEDFHDGKWIKEISEKTKKTSIEVLLNPGQKRVSIISYNLLGRKATTSDWVEFIILSEAQPYLYDDYLKKSSVWNSPILRVTHAADDGLSNDNLESEAGDPENSFFVKGKNIFFEGTKFSLVPADRSMSGGKDYQAYVPVRNVSPLTVVRRDYERSGVVVSYNADDLFSGYYRIVAENPGGMSTGLDILVFADREPVFDMSSFAYDEHFKSPSISTSSVISSSGALTIEGSGFSFDTKFTLVPSDSGIPYPFASALSRERIPLTVNSVNSKSTSGDLEVQATADPLELRSGYYKIVAESNAGRAEQLILFTAEENESASPIIKSIKGSADKSGQATFEIKGKFFSRDHTMTLVSSFDSDSGTNTRVSLSVVDMKRSGKKIFVQGSNEKLTPGIYALIIEDGTFYKRIYLEIDKRLGVKLKELTPEKVAEIFFIPTDYVLKTSDEEIDSVPASPDDLFYEMLDYSTIISYATFCPTLNGELGLGQFINPEGRQDNGELSLTGVKFSLDILRFKWFIWDIGFGAFGLYFQPEISTSFYLTTPSRFVRPFIGAGIGVHYGRNQEVEYLMEDYKNRKFGAELLFDAGITLLDYFQFKYSMNWYGFSEFVQSKFFDYPLPSGVPFFYSTFYIGATFPIRSMVYTRIPETTTLTITKGGVVSGNDYELQNDIKKIVFANGARSVEHFEEMEILQEVMLPESLTKIGTKAFYNCSQLNEITIPDGVVEIGDYAFAGCRSLTEIVLPSSIRKVSPTAFEGWGESSSNQRISVRWDADDETVRDLGGIEKLKCFNGSVNSGSVSTLNISGIGEISYSVLDVEDIYVRSTKGDSQIDIRTATASYKSVRYECIKINGKKSGDKGSMAGIRTYNNHACNYLRSGDTLNFYMQSSGIALTLVMRDENGNVLFSKELKPCKDVTKVLIPYRNITGKIAMFGIEAAEENVQGTFEASFFGFEVVRKK